MKDYFTKLSARELQALFKKRKLEDVPLIAHIESFLVKNRGYVFSVPKPGSSVILLLSGGLDSVVTWDILMRIYKLKVYPLYLRRGQIRMAFEEQSIRYFSRYFAKKHPTYFREPMTVNAFIPPLEFRHEITRKAEQIVNKKTAQMLGVPMYGSLMAEYAVNYGVYLELEKKVKARTIFFGFVEKDGRHMRYETLTFLRLMTYHLVNTTLDFRWQVTALALEKELGNLFDKEVFVRWANKHAIPIEKTFSCIKFSYFHCGKCYYCLYRQHVFKNAGVEDTTRYVFCDGRWHYGRLYFGKIVAFMSFVSMALKIPASIGRKLIANLTHYFNSVYRN